MISRRNALLGTAAALFAPPAAPACDDPIIHKHQKILIDWLNRDAGLISPRTVVPLGNDIAHLTRKSIVYLNRRYGKSEIGAFGAAALKRSFFETKEIADLVADGHNIVLIDDPECPS